MNSMIPQTRASWLLAAMVVLLLSTQVAQSAHMHVDNHFAMDCAYCLVDVGEGIASAAVAPSCLASSTSSLPAMLVSPVVSFYRPNARGPPALSN